jgi:cytochrome c2
MRVWIGVAATVALATVVMAAAAGPSAAKKVSTHKASASGAAAKGKTLAAKYRCNTCHAADLSGKPGFSPSLHASGVLKEYTPKTWDAVLSTGVTNDGGKVKPPMPVYKMSAADANAIWAYLKTLK